MILNNIKNVFEGRIKQEWIDLFIETSLGRYYIANVTDLNNTFKHKDRFGFSIIRGNVPHTTLFPKFESILQPFRMINITDIKVIIINKHPEFNLSVTGIPFMYTHNIIDNFSNFKILNDAYLFYNGHPFDSFDLFNSIKQGVLYINAIPTIQHSFVNTKSKTLSDVTYHYELWYEFTNQLIEYLLEINPKIIVALIGNLDLDYVVLNSHHSNFIICPEMKSSILNNYTKSNDFVNFNMFDKINKKLIQDSIAPINW